MSEPDPDIIERSVEKAHIRRRCPSGPARQVQGADRGLSPVLLFVSSEEAPRRMRQDARESVGYP